MKLTYDNGADVLYVEFEDHGAPDCTYEENEEGIVYRVAPSGRVVGVTIVGFQEKVERIGAIAMPVILPQEGLRLEAHSRIR